MLAVALAVALSVLVGLWWVLRSSPVVDPARCPWPHLDGAGYHCGGPCAAEPPCMDAPR